MGAGRRGTVKRGGALALPGLAAFCFSTMAHAATVVIQNNTIISNGTGDGSAVVEGNGTIATEARPMGVVTEARIDGAFDVTITVENDASLVLEADENILPLIKTETSGTLLRIFPDGSFSTRNPVKVVLSLPRLFVLTSAGSSTIVASGFDQERLDVVLTGSSQVRLAGKVQNFAATLSGSGNLNAEPLDADSASIDISGSGRCSITVRHRLVADISGSGVVAAHGNPRQRNTHVSGSGRVDFVR